MSRGYRTRHTLDEFLEMVISLNGIHPDEYLTDMLLKPHEVIGSLADEGEQLNNATRFISSQILASMQRPLELHWQDKNFTDPGAGRLSQLHVLISQAL